MSARQLRRMVLIVLWGIAQCVFLLSYVFVVRSIQVEGNVFVPKAAIVSSSSLRIGDYYWSYWLLGLPQHVQSMPQLSTASVRFCPGGTVIITVQERAAAAQVATSNPSCPWVSVTEEGIILGPVQPKQAQLPKVRLFKGAPLEGRIASEPIERFLQVQPVCEKVLGADLIEYRFDGYQSLTVAAKLLGRDIPILVGDSKTFATKDKTLYALLATLRRDGKPVKQIDVRFNNPVVTLLNPPKVASAESQENSSGANDADIAELSGDSFPSDSAVSPETVAEAEEVKATETNAAGETASVEHQETTPLSSAETHSAGTEAAVETSANNNGTDNQAAQLPHVADAAAEAANSAPSVPQETVTEPEPLPEPLPAVPSEGPAVEEPEDEQ